MAKNEDKALAPYDYGQYAGQGFEGQTREDVMIPLLKLLQANSPELETAEGAKAGMLMNSVTGELSTELLIVPAMTQHLFVEWVPRASGGGYRGVRPANDPAVEAARAQATEFGKYRLPNGNELGETFYLYAVTEGGGMIVVPFRSTKIKVYKQWNTRLRMFTVTDAEGRKVNPPMFAHHVRVTSVAQENAKGKFFNLVLEPAKKQMLESMLRPEHPLFQAAVDLRKMVEAGTATAAFESEVAPDEEPVPF